MPVDPRPILHHIREAQRLAEKHGIKNILQPGIVKELILAAELGHEVIPTKADADARDAAGHLYEYLCSLKTSNNFQIDRVTDENLGRISRNRAVYCAFFLDALTLADIYVLDPALLLTEVKRQLAASKNTISHINLPGGWVRRNAIQLKRKNSEPLGPANGG
jgi:hypothetical protein